MVIAEDNLVIVARLSTAAATERLRQQLVSLVISVLLKQERKSPDDVKPSPAHPGLPGIPLFFVADVVTIGVLLAFPEIVT